MRIEHTVTLQGAHTFCAGAHEVVLHQVVTIIDQSIDGRELCGVELSGHIGKHGLRALRAAGLFELGPNSGLDDLPDEPLIALRAYLDEATRVELAAIYARSNRPSELLHLQVYGVCLARDLSRYVLDSLGCKR